MAAAEKNAKYRVEIWQFVGSLEVTSLYFLLFPALLFYLDLHVSAGAVPGLFTSTCCLLALALPGLEMLSKMSLPSAPSTSANEPLSSTSDGEGSQTVTEASSFTIEEVYSPLSPQFLSDVETRAPTDTGSEISTYTNDPNASTPGKDQSEVSDSSPVSASPSFDSKIEDSGPGIVVDQDSNTTVLLDAQSEALEITSRASATASPDRNTTDPPSVIYVSHGPVQSSSSSSSHHTATSTGTDSTPNPQSPTSKPEPDLLAYESLQVARTITESDTDAATDDESRTPDFSGYSADGESHFSGAEDHPTILVGGLLEGPSLSLSSEVNDWLLTQPFDPQDTGSNLEVAQGYLSETYQRSEMSNNDESDAPSSNPESEADISINIQLPSMTCFRTGLTEPVLEQSEGGLGQLADAEPSPEHPSFFVVLDAMVQAPIQVPVEQAAGFSPPVAEYQPPESPIGGCPALANSDGEVYFSSAKLTDLLASYGGRLLVSAVDFPYSRSEFDIDCVLDVDAERTLALWEVRATKIFDQMMFVSGETVEPTPETLYMIEEIVRQQVIEMLTRSTGIAARRGSRSISTDDLIFLIRHDKAKVSRLRTFLSWKEVRKNVKDSDEKGGGDVGEFGPGEDPAAAAMGGGGPAIDKKQNKRARIGLPWDVSTFYNEQVPEREDEEDEDEEEMNSATLERLKIADERTKGMTKEEYVHFSECRQASFTFRKAKRFKEWAGFGIVTESKPNDDIIDVLGFMTFDIVMTLTEEALRVKAEEDASKRESGEQNKTRKRKRETGLFDPPEGGRTPVGPDHIREAFRRLQTTTARFRAFSFAHVGPVHRPLQLI
ncbi:MAG: hypothetical protein M4579_003864 [Chaenotheca gracillima]|nr:MAG: hypothetical protein M4579_003864 [Chaenotheca gracillima]